MLSGDNGLLKRAGDARDDTVVGQEKEQVELAYISVAVKKLGGNVSDQDLQAELNVSVGNNKTKVTKNSNNTLNVLFKDTEHNYNVNSGTVTRIEDGDTSSIKNIDIYYIIESNTIRMNFTVNSLETYISSMSLGEQEALLGELEKAYHSDYYEQEYPGEKIDIDLIYEAAGINSLQDFLENVVGYASFTEFVMDNFSGNDGFYDVIGLEETGITGTITLKIGDTVITQGDVSKNNDLEYSLKKLGIYTIIGETSDGKKLEKTFEPDLDTVSFAIHDVRGEWGPKSFEVVSGLNFEQWIEQEHPEHFVVSNGYVYYDEYNPGVYDFRTAICQSFSKIPATSTIYSLQYAVGED